MSVDKENFLTADINSICLWNLGTTKRTTTFKIFENGPKTGSLNSAAISSASFNQFGNSCMFLYTLSNGDIHICDLRERSNFSRKSSQLMRTSAHMQIGPNSIYSNYLSYCSGAEFLPDQTQVVSRDYMSIKVWDLRADKPYFSANVNDYMERNLSQLSREDALDDEFFMALSPDGKYLSTGGYNRTAHIIDANATTNTSITCNHIQNSGQPVGFLKAYNKQKRLIGSSLQSDSCGESNQKSKATNSTVDSSKQVTFGAWSPFYSTVSSVQTLALAYRNCIFLYESGNRKPTLKL